MVLGSGILAPQAPIFLLLKNEPLFILGMTMVSTDQPCAFPLNEGNAFSKKIPLKICVSQRIAHKKKLCITMYRKIIFCVSPDVRDTH